MESAGCVREPLLIHVLKPRAEDHVILFPEDFRLLLGEEVVFRLPRQRLHGESHKFTVRVIQYDVAVLFILHKDRIRDRIDDVVEKLLGELQLLLEILPFRYVMGDHAHMGDLALFIEIGGVDHLIISHAPAVKVEPRLVLFLLAGKALIHVGSDVLLKDVPSPHLGHGMPHDILPGFVVGFAIGFVCSLVNIVSVHHGHQILGRAGDEFKPS